MDFYGQLVAMNKPLIAAVQGYVLCGGCNLAISCDLVVAGESAIFGYPEVRLGLAATGVTPTLVHQIGRKAAFELLILCENIDAQQVLNFGMINRIVPNDQVMTAATKMAEQLASFNHDASLLTKQTLRRWPTCRQGDWARCRYGLYGKNVPVKTRGLSFLNNKKPGN